MGDGVGAGVDWAFTKTELNKKIPSITNGRMYSFIEKTSGERV